MRRTAVTLALFASLALGSAGAHAQSNLPVFGPDGNEMMTMAFVTQSTVASGCSGFAMTPCLIRDMTNTLTPALQAETVDVSMSAFLRERTEATGIDPSLIYPAKPPQVARGATKPESCWASCGIASTPASLLAQSSFAPSGPRTATLASAAYDALDEGALAPPVGSAAYPLFRNSVQLKLHIANYDVSTFKIFEWRPPWRSIRR